MDMVQIRNRNQAITLRNVFDFDAVVADDAAFLQKIHGAGFVDAFRFQKGLQSVYVVGHLMRSFPGPPASPEVN